MIDMYSDNINPVLDIDNGSVTTFIYTERGLKLKIANNTKYLK